MNYKCITKYSWNYNFIVLKKDNFENIRLAIFYQHMLVLIGTYKNITMLLYYFILS